MRLVALVSGRPAYRLCSPELNVEPPATTAMAYS